jgi:hypothetical protein
MGRPAAEAGLIHTKPGQRPKQQGLVAGGQSVAELWLKVVWYPLKDTLRAAARSWPGWGP